MKKLVTTIIILFLLTACQTTSIEPSVENAEDGHYWPTEGWLVSAPEDQGMDGQKLAAIAEYIEENNIAIDSVLVVKDGYIVGEYYFNGYDQNELHVQYSVTKSITSALVGIALEEGSIENIDQTLVDFFPNQDFLDESSKKITLEQILTMRTGLDWTEGNSGYYALMAANDPVAYMLSLPVVEEPGNAFGYCSGCSFLLSAIVQESVGMNTADFAKEELFSPLGIDDFQWETLSNGIPNGGWGLYLTPRDMAKFGYLYLNEGLWNGQQIIPAAWVSASVEPVRPVSDTVGYGYQWWIFPEDRIYAAQGLYGQKIFVIPETNMVVVITADLGNESIEFTLLNDYILAAIDE
ncbi:MAG: serine hydrolase [Anaerolineae bacterium]|jgi:CubicO group peptidase (beta-lactamase class C family)|nr:serine hydrolase [Anaerolineae bacterium]